MEIGVKIIPYNYMMRRLRREMGLTQRQLAEICEVSTSMISEIERFCMPVNEEIATQIALALGGDIDYLFPEETRSFRSRKTRSIEFVTEIQSLETLSIEEEEERLSLKDPERILEEKQLASQLVSAVKRSLTCLTSREQQVIGLRFGLTDDPKSVPEVAKLLGFTRARIDQIEAKALWRLRLPHNAKLLEVYQQISG